MYPYFLGVQCDFFVCFSKYTPKKFDEWKIILIFAVELIMIPIDQQFIK